MADTAKKMVYFDAEQASQIRLLARAAKTSETEIVRRAVTAYWQSESAKVASDTERVMDYVRTHPDGWDDNPEEWFTG